MHAIPHGRMDRRTYHLQRAVSLVVETTKVIDTTPYINFKMAAIIIIFISVFIMLRYGLLTVKQKRKNAALSVE